MNATAKAVCETYRFHGQLGLERHDLAHGSAVIDLANPNVWSSNKVCAITASTPAHIQELLAEVDALFAPLSYRHFVVDPFTPAAFSAYLALRDYSAQATIVQMVLQGDLRLVAKAPTLEFVAVRSEEDWQTLHALVLEDHAEGGRTQGKVLSKQVTDGIVAGYRGKASACQFFVAWAEGVPCAYGSGLVAPTGMGMVEDLFTLPRFRGRGIASAVIEHCVEHCRAQGAGPVLIGSHADEQPKRLYHRLGFAPVCLTQDYIKQV